MDPYLGSKYFNNSYCNLTLKDSYKINQEELKKLNIDVNELINWMKINTFKFQQRLI
jgi:hypothetical protein